MTRSFVLLLAIVVVAEGTPNATEPDINAVIDRVDHFLRYLQFGRTNRKGFQKFQEVAEDKEDVTGFFGMLGDLFTNGTIGRFENEKDDEDRLRRLYISTNGTSGALSEKLVQLFHLVNGYSVFGTWLHGVLYPNDRDVARNEEALRAIRTAFHAIFARSKAFLDELNGATAEQIRLQYPFDDDEVSDSRCYVSKLDERCSELGWNDNDDDAPVVDYTMQSLLRIMGPGCESEITEDPYLRMLQSYIYDIAKANNYSGGESNRCFHKFFIRHHNYREGQYKLLADNLCLRSMLKEKAMSRTQLNFQRAIYGLCTRIQQARHNEGSASKPAITEQLVTLQQRLLGARCVFDETCPDEETSAATHVTGLPPGKLESRSPVDEILSRGRRDSDRISCVPRVKTTTWPEPIDDRTTSSPQSSRQWVDIANTAAQQAIGDKGFPYPTSDSAVETYRAIGMLMIAFLKQSDDSRDLYEYKALVFYPANDGTEYCLQNGTRGDIYSSMHNNVRYLVARYSRTHLANATGEPNVTSLVPKLQQAFSDIDAENQCDRLKKIDGNLKGALSKFRAAAVIKCARKFVWYELGYRYFQAAWTNSVGVPTAHESEYSSKCGTIVVFP